MPLESKVIELCSYHTSSSAIYTHSSIPAFGPSHARDCAVTWTGFPKAVSTSDLVDPIEIDSGPVGWRIQRAGDGGWYGSGIPAGAFGHAGSTGTVAWADPASGVVFTLLTNGLLDVEGGVLKACGNIAAAALCDV